MTSDERCDGWIDCSDVSDENYCSGDTSSGVYISYSHSLTLDSFPGRGEGKAWYTLFAHAPKFW